MILSLKRALRFLRVNEPCANFRIFPPLRFERIDADGTPEHFSIKTRDGMRIRNKKTRRNMRILSMKSVTLRFLEVNEKMEIFSSKLPLLY